MRLSKKDPSDTVQNMLRKQPTTIESKPIKVNKTRNQIITEVAAEFSLGKPSDKYKLINNLQDFGAVLETIESVKPEVMAVDTETEGLRWSHRIIGVSFTFSEEDNYYIPFRHLTEEFQPSVGDFVEGLNYIFSLPNCDYVFHNYKFDYHKLYKEGIYIRGNIHDTMLMHYVLNENSSHALKDLAAQYIDEDAHCYEDLIKEFRRKLARKLKIKLSEFGYEHIPINIMVEYACRDTFFTYKLYDLFQSMLSEEPELNKVYKLELEALEALAAMEQVGVKLDVDILREIATRLGEELTEIKCEVWEMVGREFDLKSPKQLREVLKSKGIHTYHTTPTGEMSTSAASLEKIASRFPFIQKLLLYRVKQKLKSTYADPLPEYCDENSFIHCSYRQAVAVTGRITCKEPSLQVIPRKGGDNDIRCAFVLPDDDYIMIFVDLSQIELRMTAHYSKDPLLLNAYDLDEDIHTRTAAEIFSVKMGDVTKDQRNAAKAINFGIIYGIGPKKLSEQINISQDEAQAYIKTYLKRYAGVSSFINKYQNLAKKYGYVKSYFGRVRRLDALLDPNLDDWKRERGYRQAVNYVVQGCQHPESLILTDRGFIPIQDLNGECIKTYSGYTDMYTVFPCGKQEVVEVKTNFGSTKNSPDHKFFVYESGDIVLKDAKDLVGEDPLLYELPISIEGRDNVHISEANLELCGMFCARGNFPVDSSEKLYVRIPINREGDFNWMLNYLSVRWPDQWEVKLNGDLEVGTGHIIYTDSEEVLNEFGEWGLSSITSCNHYLPQWVFCLSLEKKSAFLRGLFCASAYFSNRQVRFKCPTYDYANSLQLLLTCIGVGATIHQRKKDRKDRHYLVRILPSSISRFKMRVGSRDSYTSQMIEAASVGENSSLPKTLIKDVGNYIYTTQDYKTNATQSSPGRKLFTADDQSYIQQMIHSGYGRREKIIKLLQRLLRSDEQRNFIDLVHRTWASVLSVVNLGYEIEMLDIELEGEDHAYVARGFYQHNSCADMFKIILSRLHKFLLDKKSKMIMNIHDEVIFYLHKEEIHILPEIKSIFEDWNFRVPIVAEIQYSDRSWGNKQEL